MKITKLITFLLTLTSCNSALSMYDTNALEDECEGVNSFITSAGDNELEIMSRKIFLFREAYGRGNDSSLDDWKQRMQEIGLHPNTDLMRNAIEKCFTTAGIQILWLTSALFNKLGKPNLYSKE